MLCSAPGIICPQSIPFSCTTRSSLWELNRIAGVFDAYVEEDITVLLAWNCLSSSNCKLGFCNTCSPSNLVSSIGNSFHFTKYSQTTLFMSFLSRTCRIFFEINAKIPSSFKGVTRWMERCVAPLFSWDLIHDIHYEFYFPLEAPIHKPPLQPS